MLEKTLESSLDCKEIKPVNPKEINPEYSLEGLMLKLKFHYLDHLLRRAYSLEKTPMLERTETEAEVPVFWSFDVNSQLIGKVPDAGKV